MVEKFIKLAVLAFVGIIVGSFAIGLVSGAGVGGQFDLNGVLPGFNNNPQANHNGMYMDSQDPYMQQHMQYMQQNPYMNMQGQMPYMNMQGQMQGQMPGMNFQGNMNMQGGMTDTNMQNMKMQDNSMKGMGMMDMDMDMDMMGMPMM